MKRHHVILISVVLGTAAFLGCGDRAAPTEPLRPAVSIEKVAPPLQGLSGSWRGTIFFHAFNGNHEGLTCDGAAAVSVILEQDGSNLSGRFRTACAGDIELRGVINGGGLSGSLDPSNGVSLGRISGTVDDSRITFQTRVTVGENSDGSGNRGGDRIVISSDVELHRQETAARNRPLLVGGARSSHGIAVQR